MKKIFSLMVFVLLGSLCLLSGAFAELEDSYTNVGGSVSATSVGKLSQSFTATSNYNLNVVALNILKEGSPSGNIVVKIYTESGDLPDVLLDTSDSIVASSISTSLSYVNFSGLDLNIISGTKYVIVLEPSTAHDSSNRINIHGTSDTSYSGGRAGSNTGTWTLFGIQYDFNFITYSPDVTTPIIENDVKDFYNSENITIQLNTTTNTNMSYVLDAGTETSICNNCNNSILNLNSLSEGAHSILFVSTDENGQANTSANFTIDTTSPVITNNIPAEINSYFFNSSQFSCTDTNIDDCYIIINSQNKTNLETATLTLNGNLSYTIYATDLAGNNATESGVLLVNPIGYVYFELANGTKLTNFDINGINYNNSFEFKFYDYGIGTHELTFSKLGYSTTPFNITITNSNNINDTVIITQSKIILNIYDRDTNQYITSNSSITLIAGTGFTGSTITGQINISDFNFVSEQYQIIISNDDYVSESLYFNYDNQETLTVNTYLIKSNQSNIGFVKIELTADTGQLIQNAICKALEWKPLESAYVSVSEGLTDSNGNANLNIELKTKLYRFTCTKAGQSITSPSQIITETGLTIPLTLQITTPTPQNIFEGLSFSLYNVSVNATHQRTIFIFNDVDNLVNQACLKIYRMDGLKLTELQSSCVDSNTGNIQLVTNVNQTYNIKAIASIKVNAVTTKLGEIIYKPTINLAKTLKDYGLDIILPLVFALVGVAIGFMLIPQNIYMSAVGSIVMVWVSVLIVPSIVSSTIAIAITTISLLMLWAGSKNN